MKILDSLRSSARSPLSEVAREHRISVGSVFDNYNYLLDKDIIKKHVSVMNFEELGYVHRFIYLFMSEDFSFIEQISREKHINSLFKLNDSYFLLDCLFSSVSDAEDFFEYKILKSCPDAKRFSFISCIKFEETLLAK